LLPVIVTRPEPGNAATLAAAARLGLDAIGVPLQEVRPIAWKCPDKEYDGLLLGSANAIRHGGASLAKLHSLPVHAVGSATARAARDAGFGVASTGEGSLQAVLDGLRGRKGLRLLRLGGKERIALRGPGNVTLDEVAIYELVDRPVPAGELGLFRRPACILVHSAGAARALDRLYTQHGLDRSAATVLALAPRIAAALESGWSEVAIAPAPGDDAMLALARRMCETPP
jgi:uroporphyrinogen-III synthase